MNRFAFVAVGSIACVTVESFLREIGLASPLFAFYVFAVAYAVSRGWAIFSGCLFGASLDFLFGHAFPFSAILFPLLAFPGEWFRIRHMDSLLVQSLPGLLIPVYAVLPRLHLFFSSLENFSVLILSCASGIVLLPLIVFATERLAIWFRLDAKAEGASE